MVLALASESGRSRSEPCLSGLTNVLNWAAAEEVRIAASKVQTNAIITQHLAPSERYHVLNAV